MCLYCYYDEFNSLQYYTKMQTITYSTKTQFHEFLVVMYCISFNMHFLQSPLIIKIVVNHKRFAYHIFGLNAVFITVYHAKAVQGDISAKNCFYMISSHCIALSTKRVIARYTVCRKSYWKSKFWTRNELSPFHLMSWSLWLFRDLKASKKIGMFLGLRVLSLRILIFEKMTEEYENIAREREKENGKNLIW